MEKVIGLLFDIEKKANQIIERANIEKHERYEENERFIARLEAGIAEENNEKIKVLMEQSEKKIEQEKQLLISNSERQLQELEAYCRNNHDALVERVFQDIIRI